MSKKTPYAGVKTPYVCPVIEKQIETMTELKTELPAHMSTTSLIGDEISVTGKWLPKAEGGLFRKSPDSKELKAEWQNIHNDAKMHDGILSTEVNHAVGQDAVLVHHVFQDSNSFLSYFDGVATEHERALKEVARPDIHLIRGVQLSPSVREAIAKRVDSIAFGEYLFGYVKNDYERPDPSSAIQVTAKWTCKDGESLDELIHWWNQVGTDAFDMEKGLVRFEVYQVIGENALIIHETFDSSNELKFHLTKGTAAKYKEQIDKVAFPENYFFRGPVSWMIRTYSKFMHLPATYSNQGPHFSQAGGSMSDGKINNNTKSEIMNSEITVVYKWTAQPGKGEDLQAIYRQVDKDMQSNEPGALRVDCHYDESTSSLIVVDLFQDANAMGFHLGTTAANHFPSLLKVAVPGAFLFLGDVPEEMKQAAINMGLDATFAPRSFGFDRAVVH